MEKDLQYFYDLISKYFAGELQGEELSALSKWIKSDVQNHKVFDEYRKTWEAIEKSKVESLDINSEWNLMKEKIPSKLSEEKEPKIIPLPAETRMHRSIIRQVLRIAAVLIVLAGITFVILHFTKPDVPSQLQMVALNEKVEGILPDGSVVTLNSGSTLDYPEEFTGENRPVTLKGEAFFEVTPDKSKPFIIAANDVMVEVVGTSFFVSADANGNVEVIVKTGKVAVYYKDHPSDKKILEPGDKAEFSGESKKITASENEDENYISWKTNVLSFNDDSLSNVVNVLNKQYNANISITDERIKGMKLTGTYNNNSLDQVLKLIESSLKIRITKKSAKQIELSADEAK